MQGFGFNGIVSNSKPREPQENFLLPKPIRAEFEAMWGRLGVKNKWAAYTAAALWFYRLSDEEQLKAMEGVMAARRRGDFRHLLKRESAAPNGGGRLNPRKAVRTATGDLRFEE
jgi:hypothetical protein